MMIFSILTKNALIPYSSIVRIYVDDNYVRHGQVVSGAATIVNLIDGTRLPLYVGSLEIAKAIVNDIAFYSTEGGVYDVAERSAIICEEYE